MLVCAAPQARCHQHFLKVSLAGVVPSTQRTLLIKKGLALPKIITSEK